MRNRPANFYVRDRSSGKKVLVTADVAHEFRDSCKFIRLDDPAPQDVNADVPMPDLRKRTSIVINANEAAEEVPEAPEAEPKPKAAPKKKASAKNQ